MVARRILRFLVTALVTFLGEAASQWWLGDPCFTQYLEAAFWHPPEYGLLGACDYFPFWVVPLLSFVTTIVMPIAIGFVFVGRGLLWQIVAVLGGVFVGVAAFSYLLRFAMLQSDVWQYGAYSPPSVLDCAVSGLFCAAIAAGGIWLRRSRSERRHE
jgi:hypothetical protein